MDSARALEPSRRQPLAPPPTTPVAELVAGSTFTERFLANEDYAIQAALEASLADAREMNKENVNQFSQEMPPPRNSWSHRPMSTRQRLPAAASAAATSSSSTASINTATQESLDPVPSESSRPKHVRHRIVFRPDKDETDSDSDGNGESDQQSQSQVATQLPLKRKPKADVSQEVDTLAEAFPDGEPIESQDLFSDSSSDENGIVVIETSSEDTDYSDEDDIRNNFVVGGREAKKRLREDVLLAPCPKHLRHGNRRVPNVPKEQVSHTCP